MVLAAFRRGGGGNKKLLARFPPGFNLRLPTSRRRKKLLLRSPGNSNGGNALSPPGNRLALAHHHHPWWWRWWFSLHQREVGIESRTRLSWVRGIIFWVWDRENFLPLRRYLHICCVTKSAYRMCKDA